MKILFAGTPDIAVPSLQAIYESSNCNFLAVLTNPDKPFGRGRRLEKSPVKKKAIDLGLLCYTPDKIDDKFCLKMKQFDFDLLVCFAYGKIFSKEFLEIFRYGGINVHPSLLPKYRGASPLISTILNRDKVGGISIQTLADEMDSGDILLQEEFLLTGRENILDLSKFCGESGAVLVSRVLNDFEKFYKNRTKQDDFEAIYCKKISREDAFIDWNRSALEIDAQIRAISPNPKCYTFYKNLELYIIEAEPLEPKGVLTNNIEGSVVGQVIGMDKKNGLFIKTGDGFLAVKKLQCKARKILDWKSFVNGLPDIINYVLGE